VQRRDVEMLKSRNIIFVLSVFLWSSELPAACAVKTTVRPRKTLSELKKEKEQLNMLMDIKEKFFAYLVQENFDYSRARERYIKQWEQDLKQRDELARQYYERKEASDARKKKRRACMEHYAYVLGGTAIIGSIVFRCVVPTKQALGAGAPAKSARTAFLECVRRLCPEGQTGSVPL